MQLPLIGELFGPRITFTSVFFAAVAIVMSGYVAYRYLATQPGAGQVTEIRPYCGLCSGKCGREVKMACEQVPQPLEPGQRVRRFQQARIEFVGRDGQSRAAWAEFSLLPKGHARIGDRVDIHFIDGFADEPEVTVRPNLFTSVVGIVALFFFMSIGARLHRKKWHGG